MNGKLDIEVHDGRVTAVWFNCQLLPFEQIDVDAERANLAEINPDAEITERIAVTYAGWRPSSTAMDDAGEHAMGGADAQPAAAPVCHPRMPTEDS